MSGLEIQVFIAGVVAKIRALNASPFYGEAKRKRTERQGKNVKWRLVSWLTIHLKNLHFFLGKLPV